MSSLIRVRVLLGGLAGGGCVALWVLSRHTSQAPVLGSYSPAALAAVVLTMVAVLMLVGLAVAPSRHLRRCESVLRGFVQWLASREPTVPPFAAAALVVVAVFAYAVLTARFFALNQAPIADQREYLILARQIQQGSLADLMGDKYREANRHPLYPVVLAWAGASEINPTAFARGKCTSVALAWLAFGVLIALIARRFSLCVAALVAVLLATNLAFLRFTILIACEGLLVLWAGLLWLTAAAIPPNSSPNARDGAGSESPSAEPVPVSCWLGLGAWAGLAFLTKGSALLLLVGLIVWLLLPAAHRRRRRRERRDVASPLVAKGLGGGQPPSLPVGEGRGASASDDKARDVGIAKVRRPLALHGSARSIALVLLAFLLVASPLLVRNIRVYGNPFYNSNTPYLFSDNFEEALRRSDPSRAAEQNESTWMAAHRYFRTHTAGQIFYRAAGGIVTEVFILLRTLGPAPLQETRALVGAPILLLALLGMAARPRPDSLLVLIWMSIFIPFFGWYVPIAAGDRFVLPLVVPVYVYAASALARLAFGWPENCSQDP